MGGKCLFPYISTDRSHSNLVTFERPLQPDIMGGFYAWDQFFTSWLDAEGYQVDYCINADHDRQPDLLDDYPAHLRICHGEYSSREECEQLQRFVARGGNLMVFAGNSFSHLVETRADGRQLYCAKTRYKKHPLGTPEDPETSFLRAIDNLRQRTIGVSYTAAVNAKSKVPGEIIAPTSGEYGFFRVTQPDHWAFAGTGLRKGTSLAEKTQSLASNATAVTSNSRMENRDLQAVTESARITRSLRSGTRRTTVSTRTWGSTRTGSTPPSQSTKQSSRGRSSPRQPSSGRTVFTGMAVQWHRSRAMF